MTGSVRITGSLNVAGNTCVVSICSPSIIGGTMSGTTIYGSTAICGAVICGGATTLTGALSGTSATFSSTISLNDDFTLNSANPQIKWASGNLRFSSVAGGTDRMVLTSAGAATFSSSVTANGSNVTIQPTTTTTYALSVMQNAGGYLRVGRDTSTGALYGDAYAAVIVSSGAYPMIFGTNDTERMRITSGGGYEYRATDGVINMTAIDTSGAGANDYGSFIFNLKRGADNDQYPNVLVLKGGNVGIGTTSPPVGLSIQGSTSDAASIQLQQTAAGGRDYRITSRNDGSFRINDDTAGSERMRITCNGNVGIGTTSPNLLLTVYGSSISNLNLKNASNGVYGFTLEASGANSELWNYANGYMRFGTNNTERILISGTGTVFIYSVYSQTSASAANVIVGSDGNLFRSTSSLKYKKDVVNYTKGLAEVMKLRPVTYKGKNEIDRNRQFAGLIAEEVHDLGLTEFVQYADDGSPDALSYQNMVALLTKAIQEQQCTICTQASTINILKTCLGII
jgi:hypothetical protein